jgi:succinoglycan biosynthesis transport protein ExoP
MLQTKVNTPSVGWTSRAVQPVMPALNVWRMPACDESTMARGAYFQQLASILRRRWWSILVIAVSGMMLAGTIGILIPPKYSATAQLLIDTEHTASTGEQEPSARNVDDVAIDTIVDTHVGMLSSRSFLRRVLGSLAGFSEPQSDIATADQSRGPAAEGVVGAANLAPASASQPGLAELFQRHLKIWLASEAASASHDPPGLDELERRIKVNRERRSRIISVSFTSPNPVIAADVVNRTVKLYVESRSRQEQELLSREMGKISDRIAELKTESDRAAIAAQNIIQRRGDPKRVASSEGPFPDQRMRELLNEATAARQLQPALERRFQDLTNRRAHVKTDAAILTIASVPDRPSSPSPFLFILPSLIMSAIGAALLAVTRERLDRGLRSAHDVESALGIPCIGLVPQLSRKARSRPHRRLLSEPSLAYTEAIRSIVAHLRLASPRRAPKVILVSSSVPREGKTTLAVSLAAYGALLGRRVLLVDLDFQHPSVFRELKRSRVTVGSEITDLLLQDQMPTNFIEHLSDLKLDSFPLAHCPADPLSLFGGDHLPRLKRLLCENYDCVILDGPPLLGIAEARLLGALADQVLFVVKWGCTRQDVARTALDLLHSACTDSDTASVPMAIVNQVNLKKHAQYGFGDVAEAIVRYRSHYTRVQA